MTELSWTATTGWPLLAALQLLPLFGAILVFALGERVAAVAIGRLVAFVELGMAIAIYRQIDATSATLQLAERLGGFGYHAAADGVTALFVLLGALIVLLMTLYGMVRGLAQPGRLLALILFSEALLMSMLVTMNLLWFALASLLELSVAAYLIGHWSTSTRENRILVSRRFLQFQGVGLLLLLGGVVMISWEHADIVGHWSFDLLDLTTTPVQERFQTAAFFLLFYGLAVRTPLFPLHGWLPDAMHRGMVSVAPSLLLGVKVGIYGMLRFVLPLTPEAVAAWQGYVVGFAMVGVFYAAILAFLQTNLRRLLSFAVVSHTSLIVIGLFSLQPLGIAGAVLLSVNFGLAVTVMLFMVGFVFRRTHSTDLVHLGGLFERIPFIATCFLVGGLAIVGMPGTPGFDAVHLMLEASMQRFGALPTVAAALGNVAAAGFLLWAFQKAFIAPRPPGESVEALERTHPMEVVVGGAAVVVLLLSGFYFETWLNLIEAATQAMALRFAGAA
ncbi:MAG: NADH-quinone oxidoreductase subunit M [Rhodocyclaceae bacterium]|nr:NADH-quinone oxidoreductase subunit M [Rhodocyclaceae bacterium]